MIKAEEISGALVAKMKREENDLLASWIKKYIERLRWDLNRIAMSKIAEAGYEESLTFQARQSGPKQITVTPSDPVLFRKLEFGEFDEHGEMKNPPHSVLKEWRVFVRIN